MSREIVTKMETETTSKIKIRALNKSSSLILQAAAEGDINYLKEHVQNDDELESARCESGCTALHWAAGCSQCETITYLIENRNLFQGNVNLPVNKKKAKGRTPLHYSCRNGSYEAVQLLVEKYNAKMDVSAKHGVTPLQLAVWQNHLQICKYLVHQMISRNDSYDHNTMDSTKSIVNQMNDFNCGLVHWIGLCPFDRANNNENTKNNSNATTVSTENNKNKTTATTDFISNNNENDGKLLLPLAQWLSDNGCNFHDRQKQGHTALHKAAWGGHLALIQYLRDVHDLYDDLQDHAGNYAADLADMAHTERHAKIAKYLRQYCSRERIQSCRVLGITDISLIYDDSDNSHNDNGNTALTTHDSNQLNFDIIRQAYLKKIKQVHPDKQGGCKKDFDLVQKAYEHLMLQNGDGNQSNPAHSLHLMLQQVNLDSAASAGSTTATTTSTTSDDTDNYDNVKTDKIRNTRNDCCTSTIQHGIDRESNNQNIIDDKKEQQEADPQGEVQPQQQKQNNFFKARLVAVLLEYGDRGLDLSNLKKKWKQVWPDTPFPSNYYKSDDGNHKDNNKSLHTNWNNNNNNNNNCDISDRSNNGNNISNNIDYENSVSGTITTTTKINEKKTTTIVHTKTETIIPPQEQDHHHQQQQQQQQLLQPNTQDFPTKQRWRRRKAGALSKWILQEAGDVIDVVVDNQNGGSIRLFAKTCSQAQVAAAAAATSTAIDVPASFHS